MAACSSSTVIGVIDEKFENGYIVSVRMGSEELKGVLYHSPPENNHRGRLRRRRSEVKKRDPAQPKPKRSGYNFFFAEQHAVLKPHFQGKETDIGRRIGELWTKLSESEKLAYQEMGTKDKERYRTEMEEYEEKQKKEQVVMDAVPLRQWPSQSDVDIFHAAAIQMNNEAEPEGTAVVGICIPFNSKGGV